MGKEYYCRQKFLFEKFSNDIDLEKYYATEPEFLQDYREQENLFDDDNISRSIDISELDSSVDTLEDFMGLISRLSHVKILYILDTRKKMDNIIITKFQMKSLKAYIQYFEEYGKQCKILSPSFQIDCL